MVAIVAGGVLLSWEPGGATLSRGALFSAGACLCWAIDNNLTRTVSTNDAMQLAAVKGLLPEAQACTYACSGLTAYSALKKCAPLGEGDTLLVIGAGGVGLSGVRMAARALGVRPVVAEIDRSKWDLARQAGVTDCIDPTDADATKAFMRASGGAAAVIDFVGAAATFSFGLSTLSKGGKLVCVGLFGGAAQVMPATLPLRAVTITGSYVGSLSEMGEMMALARQDRLPALPVTTRPLAEVNEALAGLRSGVIRGRA